MPPNVPVVSAGRSRGRLAVDHSSFKLGRHLRVHQHQQGAVMLKRPDHVTISVTDLAAARSFFELLGFEVTIEAVISGEVMSNYMNVPDVEADHVTMVLPGAEAHFEIQLLHYRHPAVAPDPSIRNLARPGFNHLAFVVDDMDAMLARLTANGVKLRNEMMTYHDRKLVFIEGPEGVTIELAQWM